MSSENLSEEKLISRMKRLTAPYREAISILQKNAALSPGTPQNDVADHNKATPTANSEALLSNLDIFVRLKPSLDLITRYEQEVQPLRREWNQSEQKAGPELSHLIQQHRELLNSLIVHLNGIEEKMAVVRGNMVTSADQSARRLAMRRAYQPSSQRR